MTDVVPAAKPQQTPEDLERLAQELNAKFARLVRSLKTERGQTYVATWFKSPKTFPVNAPNMRGTDRFKFETEFAHLQNEFQQGAPYLRPKLIDRMSQVIANVINKLKEQQPQEKGAQQQEKPV